MDRVGIKAKPLAIAAGLSETGVRDIMDGRVNDPRVGTLVRLADYLQIPVSRFIGDDEIALVGRIGAGGAIAYMEVESDDTVPRPPYLAGPLEALEVVGDSMLPRYSSGDVVFISRMHDGVKDEYYGEFCAVRLSSGETFLKLLSRGTRPGFATLRSLNAADMEDVEIEWATPIVSVMPRYARKLLRR
ncbi:XRE family transcriptional regulator [Rhizorhabdus wittichii DC-6]|nr:XRE family transcriptional regulator [Rhizorhabdus wittichii DC-6]